MLEGLDGGGGEYFAWKVKPEPTFEIDGQACEIKKFLIDFDSLQTGWCSFKTGGPEWQLAEVPGASIPNPGNDKEDRKEWKPGFQLRVFVTAKHGAPTDGMRPWETNQKASRDALKAVWPSIHAAAANNKGKFAVVEVVGTKKESSGSGARVGDTVVPQLKLVGWVKIDDNTPAPSPEPPPPPKPTPAPQPSAAADEDLF